MWRVHLPRDFNFIHGDVTEVNMSELWHRLNKSGTKTLVSNPEKKKERNKNYYMETWSLFHHAAVIVLVFLCISLCVYKWRCSQPLRQKGQRLGDSSTLCRTFSLACRYSLLLSPRQRSRGQYSTEHGHYSGQWLGLICHEYKENHFQEQSLQQEQQPRKGTRCKTQSVITAAAAGRHRAF